MNAATVFRAYGNHEALIAQCDVVFARFGIARAQNLFERFLVVKDDLVDAYARGDLIGQKRARFEQHFLASEPRRERVEAARGFIRAVTAASTNTVTVDRNYRAHTAISWWQSISKLFAGRPLVWQGALAVLLLVALAGSWLLVRQFQSRRSERERLQNEEAARRRQGRPSCWSRVAGPSPDSCRSCGEP